LSSAQASKEGGSSFSSNPGRIAGVVVGVILAVLLIVGALLFYRHRRKKQGMAALYGADSPTSGGISAGGAGVIGGRRRSQSFSTLGLVGEKSPASTNASPGGTQNIAGVIPTTAGGEGAAVYDQRLDPGQLFMRFDHKTGSSRMSVRSLQDDTDYSRRVLRLANPDD